MQKILAKSFPNKIFGLWLNTSTQRMHTNRKAFQIGNRLFFFGMFFHCLKASAMFLSRGRIAWRFNYAAETFPLSINHRELARKKYAHALFIHTTLSCNDRVLLRSAHLM